MINVVSAALFSSFILLAEAIMMMMMVKRFLKNSLSPVKKHRTEPFFT